MLFDAMVNFLHLCDKCVIFQETDKPVSDNDRESLIISFGPKKIYYLDVNGTKKEIIHANGKFVRTRNGWNKDDTN